MLLSCRSLPEDRCLLQIPYSVHLVRGEENYPLPSQYLSKDRNIESRPGIGVAVQTQKTVSLQTVLQAKLKLEESEYRLIALGRGNSNRKDKNCRPSHRQSQYSWDVLPVLRPSGKSFHGIRTLPPVIIPSKVIEWSPEGTYSIPSWLH